MGETAVEKIARRHMTAGPERPLRPGDTVSLRPRHVLTHDNTAAVMKKFAAIGAPSVYDARQPVFALDHDIQNTSEENRAKYRAIEAFAREHGVDFHPAGEGIGHQIIVAEGYAQPGSVVVASDSHANTYGALGALGTPVVRTDAAALWATGEFWWSIPRTVRVVLEGRLREGVSGKDVILALCAVYDRGEVLNAALEFAGPGVAGLGMDARFTIANMTTEWGALTGWFPVDATALDYLRDRRARLEARGVDRITATALDDWATCPPEPDPDAGYAAEIVLDLGEVPPFVTGPDTVRAGRPLTEAAAAGIPVDRAYLVSCVNARLADLEDAAEAIRGRRVAPGVSLYVAAASREVQDAAEASGAWADLLEAGARPLPPGCGPCIGLGEGLLEEGEVGISATNRNFRGRMGSPEARVYLASPAVVAASAAEGRIAGPAVADGGAPRRRYEEGETAPPPAGDTPVVEGFPRRVAGRLVFLPRDSLDTDGIYGKDHTYREGMTAEAMARVVMENYDPAFRERTAPGDIVVAGRNFGTGSSREQAATALQAAGIRAVVAASFSRTYLRNAFNNGFVCVECPALVDRVGELLSDAAAAGERTVVPGDDVELDFGAGEARYREEAFPFTPPGPVAQELVVAGGLEAQVRRRLATDTSADGEG